MIEAASASRIALDPDTERAFSPGAVVEVGGDPVISEAAVGRHEHTNGMIDRDRREELRVGADSERRIGDLRLVSRRVAGDDVRSVRAQEREQLALTIEAKVRVQLGARVPTVLLRREDDEEASGIERHRGEGPLGEVLGVVRQIVAGQVDRGVAAVVELDPVAVFAVLVPDRIGVEGEELADHQPFLRHHGVDRARRYPRDRDV